MTLSASGLQAYGPLAVDTDQVQLWVGPEDRAILRDVRVVNTGSTEASVLLWIETPGLSVASYICFEVMAGISTFTISDGFIVFEPGWKLHSYATGSGIFLNLAGHWFPGAGPSG